MKHMIIVFAIMLAAITVSAGPSDEYNCPDDADLMMRLHNYAFLEHHAFRPEQSSPQCNAIPPAYTISPHRIISLSPLDPNDRYYWTNVVATANLDGRSIALYVSDEDEDRTYYLACSARDGVPRFILSIGVRVHNVLTWTGLVPRYMVHILGGFGFDADFVASHSIESKKLINVDSGDIVFLVRGTSAAQLVPNISTVLNDQCPFELAAAAVKQIAMDIMRSECSQDCRIARPGEYGVARLSVVGHSLGGSAVQHVAVDYAIDPASYGDIDMDIYSFNSYGAGMDIEPPLSSSLVSYCTYDDFACYDVGAYRFQPGKHVVYIPGEGVEGKHGIASVQNQICACLYGNGYVEISD